MKQQNQIVGVDVIISNPYDAQTNTVIDEMAVTVKHLLKSHEEGHLDAALRPTTFAFTLDEKDAHRAVVRPRTRAAPSELANLNKTSRNNAYGLAKSLKKQRKETHEGTQFACGTPLGGTTTANTVGILSGSNWTNPVQPLSGKHADSQGARSLYSQQQQQQQQQFSLPGSIAAVSGLRTGVVSRNSNARRKGTPLLADMIQAKKNLLDESSIFGKNHHTWDARNYVVSATSTQANLLKSDFKTTRARAGSSATPDISTLNLDDPKQMRMAALKLIKTHQKQQKMKQHYLGLRSQSTTPTPQPMTHFHTFDERKTSNKGDETVKVASTPKMKEGEVDLFMKTADGGFTTIKSSTRGKWNLNFDNEKVKAQASENYFSNKRNSFKVNPLRHLNSLLENDFKKAPVFTRKKQSVQLSHRRPPDSDELLNIEIHKHQTSRQAAQSSLLQKTYDSSTMTKDTTTKYSVRQMKSGKEQQTSSLSPRRIKANDSILFGGPSTKQTETSSKTAMSLIQKTAQQLSKSYQDENIPKDALKANSIALHQNNQGSIQANTEQQNHSVRMHVGAESIDQYSLTLGSQRNPVRPQQPNTSMGFTKQSAGDQLMINENFTRSNDPTDSIMSMLGGAGEGSDPGQLSQQQGRPMLPMGGEFESIFTMKQSDDQDASEVQTPNLPSFQECPSAVGQDTTITERAIDEEDVQKWERLDFTSRHRSTLKGLAKVPFEFIFLKDEGKFEQQMRKQCARSAKDHKANMKNMIARLDKESIHESTVTIEQIIAVEESCLRTKFELQNALYQKFDVRKGTRKGYKMDSSWHQKVDNFLEKDKMLTGHHLYAHQFQIFDENFATVEDGSTKTNKAGDVETQEALIEHIKRLEDSAKNMTAFVNPQVTESTIPIQVLYNKKIEQIRLLEYEGRTLHLPIKFDISDSYAGIQDTKLVKIESASAPKTYVFEIELGKGKGTKIYETQVERLTRNRRFKQEAPLVITDYTRGAKDNAPIADFVEALHKRVKNQQNDLTFNKKLFSKVKSEAQQHEKFTKKIVGMRRGNQFNFVKMERPELEDRKKKKAKKKPLRARLDGDLHDDEMYEQSSESSSLSEDSSIEDTNPTSPVANLKDPRTAQSDRFLMVSKVGKKPMASSLGRQRRDTAQFMQKEMPERDESEASKQSHSSFGSQATNKKKLSKLVSSEKSEKTKTQVSFVRQKGAKKITQDVIRDPDVDFENDMDQEQLVSHTITKDFESKYEQQKAERARRALETAEVSIYEGIVPVHQRLTLLCYDFLESTWDFELNELFNFQGNISGVEQSMQDHKAEKMSRLIKELFKKYQLEIVTPNIDYIVNKFKTSFELYKADPAGWKNDSSRLKAKELLSFNHSTFDKLPETNKVTENKKGAAASKMGRRDAFCLLLSDLESFQDLIVPAAMTKHKSNSIESSKKRSEMPHLATTTIANKIGNAPQKGRSASMKAKSMPLRDIKAPARLQQRQVKGGVVSEEDSFSDETLSLTPRTGINAQQRESDKGRWFKHLDWEEEERMKKFGLNRHLQQTITKTTGGTKPSSRNKMPATVLAMLSETSAKIFESSFDHTALRKDIVKQKSMFSRNLRIKEIMSNDAALFKRITGQDYVPEQQFL